MIQCSQANEWGDESGMSVQVIIQPWKYKMLIYAKKITLYNEIVWQFN